MKIDAVALASSNLKKTIAFYTLLGFDFPELEEGQSHVEPHTPPGSARLMIDTKDLITEIIGETPRPGNHSGFAVRYDVPAEVDEVCRKLAQAGFDVVKEPWDAFWGQRYAIASDPDGYKVDLYAPLSA